MGGKRGIILSHYGMRMDVMNKVRGPGGVVICRETRNANESSVHLIVLFSAMR